MVDYLQRIALFQTCEREIDITIEKPRASWVSLETVHYSQYLDCFYTG